MSSLKEEIENLSQKIIKMIQIYPEKAAIIITHWVSRVPERKNNF